MTKAFRHPAATAFPLRLPVLPQLFPANRANPSFHQCGLFEHETELQNVQAILFCEEIRKPKQFRVSYPSTNTCLKTKTNQRL
jgi:hypothetical protein